MRLVSKPTLPCRRGAYQCRSKPIRRSVSVTASSVQPPLVVVGSINADYVLSVDRLPLAGETLSASTLDIFPGGKVCVVVPPLRHRSTSYRVPTKQQLLLVLDTARTWLARCAAGGETNTRRSAFPRRLALRAPQRSFAAP